LFSILKFLFIIFQFFTKLGFCKLDYMQLGWYNFLMHFFICNHVSHVYLIKLLYSLGIYGLGPIICKSEELYPVYLTTSMLSINHYMICIELTKVFNIS